jgi:hypothetical protein
MVDQAVEIVELKRLGQSERERGIQSLRPLALFHSLPPRCSDTKRRRNLKRDAIERCRDSSHEHICIDRICDAPLELLRPWSHRDGSNRYAIARTDKGIHKTI